MARWKQPWSEGDIERLRILAAGTKPLSVVAKELDRTAGSVLAKVVAEKIPNHWGRKQAHLS